MESIVRIARSPPGWPRGLYASAGRYPATVRFANADSNINNDSKADVRAMSFAVEPPGGTRQDFSTNDRTTFPINDAHAFATTVKVVTAPTMAAGVWALPFRDKLSFARTAVLGAEQEHQSLLPYQTRRYWSTVPFRQGPIDVIKYSLTPCVGNPAADLEVVGSEHPAGRTGAAPRDRHGDELLRLRPAAPRPAGHDLLGAAAGRRRSGSRTPASSGRNRRRRFISWRASRSCRRQSCQPATCEAWHIDVTENSTPDTTPLGSINRARWRAEAASRKARLGQ